MTQNDFGFSLIHEQHFIDTESRDHAARKIAALIKPLLHHLAQSPENDIIKWPGRERISSINDIQHKINEILNEQAHKFKMGLEL